MIFVFGSNLAGRHGRGAAKHAVDYYGAQYGVGEGHTGHAYAIPTKDEKLRTLPLEDIKISIHRFRNYARLNRDDTFLLTPIGTGLAGYHKKDIAPYLIDMPDNIVLASSWFDKEWWND